MEYVSARELFNQAIYFLEGRTEKGEPHEQNLDKAEANLQEILNHNLGDVNVIYLLGSVALSRGNFGHAVLLLSQVTQIKPKMSEAWNNLGLAYRGMNDWDKCTHCLEQAATLANSSDVWCNLGSSYCNRNEPEKAVEYTDKALTIDPSNMKAHWHKALALLEMRKWETAWDYHEARLNGGANMEVAHRNYHGDEQTPTWDGKTKGRLVIHGEQGLGDEIMFASCIPDAIETGCEIIFEPSPRMEQTFRRAFPNVKVFGTNEVDGRRWVNEIGKPDFKIGLGSLPKFFRRSAGSFPGTPYLIPDPAKRAWWGDKLRALGARPNIGIAWQGGVAWTRIDARSMHPLMLAPLLQGADANWISLQYDKSAPACVDAVREKLGVKISHWPQAVSQINPTTGKQSDLDDLVALISKLDLVITVCQTAVHVAGALGIPTLCLTPSEPSWRYGAGDSPEMPWYKSVSLLRQEKGTRDWLPVIETARRQLEFFLSQRKVG